MDNIDRRSPGPEKLSAQEILENMPTIFHDFHNSRLFEDDPETFDRKIKEWESKIPDVTSEVLSSLGVPMLEAVTDERADSFRKEGRTAPKNFAVVRDGEGKPWLLKKSNFWETDISDMPTSKIKKLQILRDMQAEAVASGVADIIGYPIAETKVVQHEGEPAIAYAFIEGAEDVSSRTNRDPFSNPEDALTRPLFNLLVGARGDSAFQGIADVRNGNKYFANDIAADLGESLSMAAELKNCAPGSVPPEDQEFGAVDLKDPQTQDAARAFIEKLRRLTPDTAREAIKNFSGGSSERRQWAEELVNRAKTLAQAIEASL